MNNEVLRAVAACWLRYDKRCVHVMFEVTTTHFSGRADVLGITDKGIATEIEIKRSMSDFRADRKKAKHDNFNRKMNTPPHLFYFMVPPQLVEKVQQNLPKDAGLLTVSERGLDKWTKLPGLVIVRRARRNKDADTEFWGRFTGDSIDYAGMLCSMAKEIAKQSSSDGAWRKVARYADLLHEVERTMGYCYDCTVVKGGKWTKVRRTIFEKIRAELWGLKEPQEEAMATGELFAEESETRPA